MTQDNPDREPDEITIKELADELREAQRLVAYMENILQEKRAFILIKRTWAGRVHNSLQRMSELLERIQEHHPMICRYPSLTGDNLKGE